MTEGATGRAGTLREEVARLHEPPVLGFAIASACLAALAGGLVPVLALGPWPLRAVVLLPLALGAVARFVPEGRGVRVACFGLGGIALAYAGMRAVAGDGPTARLAVASVSLAIAVHAMTMPRPPRALRVTLALSIGLQAAILAARVAFAG